MKANPFSSAPTAATVATAPVANTTVGVYTFSTAAGPVLVANLTGQTAYITINSGGTPNVTTTAHFIIPTSTVLEISLDRQVLIKELKVWLPVGATEANFKVYGWTAANA